MSPRSRGRKMPPKRKKPDGPAPIRRLKVSPRGARPPIWRRLEVPADTSLAALHGILPIAFGWADGHPHAFETPFGDFGVADPELGHRSEKPVTLEQVAPDPGDKIRYTYDFGDDWDHEILVEKVLERQDVAHPRCTGGRRAAPPDDCGGIGSHHDLVEVIADPDHPEHHARLEWLGLDSAAGFKPDRFSTADVTEVLIAGRHR
ncbi:plasmid pRiA4b ORF-3 family protein [Actinoplanes sp. G11-F43]|uniref:plasmid pRiA4b ORF-3 family protein n=1 Tax=Actinoplanes sp. G11-F43 TaxID=3424130 RepID=UPI003D34BCAF